MIEKSFIFLAGHHRSGTSLVHEILRSHPSISGFSQTGVPQDEGQHLQSVIQPGQAFGGPGKYIFKQAAHMNENHHLATSASSQELMRQWEKYYDGECEHYIEKSPPNIIRTRFLQAIFPNSKFIVIVRHPLAVSYATKKWSGTSTKSLIEHTLLGYETLLEDMKHLRSVHALRYEDFVANPQGVVDEVYDFLELKPEPITHDVKKDVNENYFSMWEKNRGSLMGRIFNPVSKGLELRFNRLGYSVHDCRDMRTSPFLSEKKD